MIKTEVIILNAADLGETDRLLTIYSKEFGKIRVMAKGIKKLESKLRGHLEPLSYSQMILVEGKKSMIVKDAILIDQFLKIRNDLEKFKIAHKIMNLVDEFIVCEEQDNDIWNLFLETIKELNVRGLASHIKREFQNSLIRLLGYDSEQVKSAEDIY